MAENIEKKVLVSATIVDNFVRSADNLDIWKKKMKELQQIIPRTQAEADALAKKQMVVADELAKANNQFREAKKAIESASKSEDILNTVQDKTIKTLGEMQRELAALRNTPLDAETLGEDGVKQVKQRMADLTAAIQDYKNEIKGLDTGEVFANAADSINFAVSSVNALANGLKVIGVNTDIAWLDNLQKKTTELIALTQAMGVVTEYLEKKKYKLFLITSKNFLIEKAEAAAKLLHINITKREAAAEAAFTVVKTKGTIATRAAAVAQLVWNVALAACPLLIMIAGIGLLIAGIIGLVKVLDKSASAQEAANKAAKAYEEQHTKTTDAVEANNRRQEESMKNIELAQHSEIATMKANGATAEQIAKKTAEYEEQKRNEKEKTLRKNYATHDAELMMLDQQMTAEKTLLATMKKGSDEYEEQNKKIYELTKTRAELVSTMISETQATKEIAIERQEAAQKAAAEEEEEEEEEEKKNAKERAQKAAETALKLLDQQKKLTDEQVKLTQTGLSKDFATQQTWQATEFSRQEAYEKEKLAMQRKFGQITAKDYAAALDLLSAQRSAFEEKQLADAQKK